MKEPIVVEKFADDGEHSHWDMVDPESGDVLCSYPTEDDFPTYQEFISEMEPPSTQLDGNYLAIEISRYIHNNCKDVPHDIGFKIVDIVKQCISKPK